MKTQPHAWLFALALSLSLAACEDSGSLTKVANDSVSDAQPTDTDDATAPTSSDDTADSLNSGEPSAIMSGTYAMLLSASSKQIGVPLVKTQITVSRSFFLVQATPDGPTRLRTHEKVCGLYIKLETWINKAIVPDQFVKHSGIIERHIELPSAEPGTPWISEDVYEVRGARLDNPISDPLPASGSAAPGKGIPCDETPLGSQCDQDEDGQPGMTNLLTGALSCKLYVAQRWHAALAGEIIDTNTVAGPLSSAASDQTVLAASVSLCEQVNMRSVEVLAKCPEHFYFKMVRVPDSATCDNVMALTSCDENLETCEGDTASPLNPSVDDPASCK